MRDVGLAASDDDAVWRFAAAEGFAIVTKDDDFRQRSFLHGSPPKVIWVRLGNCRTADVEAVLRANGRELDTFGSDPENAFLVLTRDPAPDVDTGQL